MVTVLLWLPYLYSILLCCLLSNSFSIYFWLIPFFLKAGSLLYWCYIGAILVLYSCYIFLCCLCVCYILAILMLHYCYIRSSSTVCFFLSLFCPYFVPVLSLFCPYFVPILSLLCPYFVPILSLFCPYFVLWLNQKR